MNWKLRQIQGCLGSKTIYLLKPSQLTVEKLKWGNIIRLSRFGAAGWTTGAPTSCSGAAM